MAIDLCSDNSSSIASPRISFSHDLHQNDDIVPIEPNPHGLNCSLIDSGSDQFNFCTIDSIKSDPPSADELFSNGLILPRQLQQRFVTTRETLTSLPPLPLSSSTSKISKPEIVEFDQKHQSKSFWRIKRSTSVHCDNSYKKSSIWSLPLLKRSNSTGSAKDQRQKRNPLKEQKSSMGTQTQHSFYAYSMSQKPPVKKNYGNGVKISPVINVAPPFISKGTANIFGLGSFFGNGKDKKIKK
ncbi:hypothetical protein LguiA_009309 [Lonicera macranthoides]